MSVIKSSAGAVPAMPASATKRKHAHSPIPGMPALAGHALLSTLMAFLMLLLYLGGFHRPASQDLNLAIVTDNPQIAAAYQAGLQEALGEGAHIYPLASAEEARIQLQNRELQGAYIPEEGRATVLIASGASGTTAEIVNKIFQSAAQKQGVALTVEDLVPLEEADPIGQNSFFYLVALSVGSYATSLAIAAVGMHSSLKERLLMAFIAALAIPTLFVLASNWGFGVFEGHLGAAWGLSLVYSAAVLMIGIGLRPIVTHYSTLLMATLFVGMNFTSSGGVFSPEVQPAFFGFLHEFWIGAGFVETMRNLTYFPQLPNTHSLAVLFGWLLVGFICLIAGKAWENRQRQKLHFAH